MRAIKYRELKQMYDLSGPDKTVRHLQEALEQGHLQPEDFSIRELAEATLSSERVRQMDPEAAAPLCWRPARPWTRPHFRISPGK